MLLDNDGPIEIARTGPACRQISEALRVLLVIRELLRYNIYVAALQEKTWFCTDSYTVGKSVILTAGRPTPQSGESRQRGEGVALVLSAPAIAAWKSGGQQWQTWGSRIVKATLCSGKRPSEPLHVLSCYSPMFAACRETKEAFYDDLQSVLDEILAEETYVILGDFNARVRSRGAEDDQWQRVRGPCGLGVVNEAGADLLNFLLLNEATICNTWFQKKNIYKQTWQHPKTKRWHCIDYVMMRQKDRRRCVDAEVKRGAECHTDYQLLLAKLLVSRRWFKKGMKMTSKRFAVSKLKRDCCLLKLQLCKQKTTGKRVIQ